MKQISLLILSFCIIILLTQCLSQTEEMVEQGSLPCLGNKVYTEEGDTLCHTIPDFEFLNQDSQKVTNETFKNKAYVVDFFFTNCPTICPKVTKQMLRLHDYFKEEEKLLFLAHTIDPKRDSVKRLAHYAKNLGVTSEKWHFVTGVKDNLYEIADDYFSIAIEDDEAPGGFNHSGRLILVDRDRKVRAFCDGTDSISVTRFIGDVKLLLNEM